MTLLARAHLVLRDSLLAWLQSGHNQADESLMHDHMMYGGPAGTRQQQVSAA